MRDDDRQFLLTIALEMRLAARNRAAEEPCDFSPARMIEIAETLERIGSDSGPVGLALVRPTRHVR